jgi:homogentisate phytyltransferase/homogentisate geranylgeranyltransferase
VIGTIVSVVALWVLAIQAAPSPAQSSLLLGSPQVLTPLLLSLTGALATNVYIVGLNQLTDVDIDRVNKPYLPLASGALSMSQGRAIVGASVVIALVTGLVSGPFLTGAFVIGIAVGSAYSLPPLRLKRFPFWAAASVSLVRGVVVNVGVYLHFSSELAGRAVLPLRIGVLAVAVVVLGLVIAWFKDVPDMEGDRRYGVRTLSLRLGPRRVLVIGLAALAVCQLGIVAVAVAAPTGLHAGVLSIGSLSLLFVALMAARKVDFDVPRTFVRFYLLIWVVFYAQYVVFAAAGTLA